MQTDSPPFVGPVSFTSEDQRLFFGRDIEASNLVSLISAYRATLLYAVSGAGKSSLLNAKVMPALEALGARVLGATRVSGPPGLVDGYRPQNIFSFYAIHNLQPQASRDLATRSLADFLVANSTSADEEEESPLSVLLLDQFEELFTTFADHWEERRAFFKQIGEALRRNRRLRIVFSMREELVARLDPYLDELPDALRVRLRLERLSKGAALEAITRPLEATGVTYAEGVAEKLVDRLRRGRTGSLGEFVEPMHLQIVCRRLWLALGEKKIIDDKALEELADVDDALSEYYEAAIRSMAAELNTWEGTLRNRVESDFITRDRKRVSKRVIEGTSERLDRFVETLSRRHLIRGTPSSEGASWYEISHDLLVEPILRSNQEWRDSDPSYREYARLESRCEQWEKLHHDSGLLLDGKGLDSAFLSMANAKQVGYDVPDSVRTYIEASEQFLSSQEEKRKRRRDRLAGIVVVVVVLLGALIVSELRSRDRDQVEMSMLSGMARSRLAEGKPKEALSLAVRAVSQGASASVESRKVLMDSLRANQGVWLSRGSPLQAVRLSSDGRRALTLSALELCVWSTKGQQRVCHDTVRSWKSAEFSPLGNFVWAIEAADSRSRNGSPREFFMWTATGGEQVLRLRVPVAASPSVSANDKYLAVTLTSGLMLYDLTSRRWLRLAQAVIRAEALAFTTDEKNLRLVVARKGQIVLFGPLPTLHVMRAIPIGEHEALDVAISPGDRYAVLENRSQDSLLRVDLVSKELKTFDDLSPTSEPMFIRDRPVFVLSGEQGLRYVRANDGSVLETRFTPPGGRVYGRHGVTVTVKPQGNDSLVTVHVPSPPSSLSSSKESVSTTISRLLENTSIGLLDISETGKLLMTGNGSVATLWNLEDTELQLQATPLKELKRQGCDALKNRTSGKLPDEVKVACSQP